jgi:hypothetical protein
VAPPGLYFSQASKRQPLPMTEPRRDKDAPELDALRPALTTLAAIGGRAVSATCKSTEGSQARPAAAGPR